MTPNGSKTQCFQQGGHHLSSPAGTMQSMLRPHFMHTSVQWVPGAQIWQQETPPHCRDLLVSHNITNNLLLIPSAPGEVGLRGRRGNLSEQHTHCFGEGKCTHTASLCAAKTNEPKNKTFGFFHGDLLVNKRHLQNRKQRSTMQKATRKR